MPSISTTTQSAQPSDARDVPENVTSIGAFAKIPIALFPALFSVSRLALHAFLIIVARSDGWTRRGRLPPRVRAGDVAAELGASYRRTTLALAELERAELAKRLGKAQDPRGCQWQICPPPSYEAGGSELEPEAWKRADQSNPPSSDPPASMLGSFSIRHARASEPDHKDSRSPPARAGARAYAREGGGGSTKSSSPDSDPTVEAVLELFAEPRWYAHGAKHVRSRVHVCRNVATDDQILDYVRTRLGERDASSLRYKPAILDVDAVAAFVKLRARAREHTAAPAASSPREPAKARPPAPPAAKPAPPTPAFAEFVKTLRRPS